MSPETASVVVAALMALASLGVAVLNNRRHGAALAENTAKTKQVLHQVQNDHGTNFRDDVDALREQMLSALERVEAAQGKMGGLIGGLTRDVQEALRHGKEHDVASALVVHELKARDDALAAELARLYPQLAGRARRRTEATQEEPGSPPPKPS